MKWLELSVPPVVLFMLFALIIGGVFLLTPTLPIPLAIRLGLSGFIGLLAMWITVSSALAFRRAHTTLHPVNPNRSSSLVTHGWFRVSRNPIYLAMLILLADLCLLLASPFSLVVVFIFHKYLTRFQIEPEERALSVLFGQHYKQYTQQVRRWL